MQRACGIDMFVTLKETNIECPEEIAEEVASITLKCMEAGGKPFCTRAHLGADLARNKDGSIPNCWVH